jgi:hypothetical protein
MKGSSFECGDLQSHSLPGTGDNDLAVRGACSPRSEPSVSPPQTQQDAPVSQLPARSLSNGKSRSLIGLATPPDPQQRVIDRAMLNDQNELGLILDRSVEMNRSPELLHTLVAQSVGRMQLGYDAPLLIANFDCTN